MMLLFRAITLFFIIDFIFSQDSESLFDQGQMQLSSGDLISAESSFNSALQFDPSFAPALQALSKLCLYKGDLKEASKYANQAVQKDEDFREWANQVSEIGKNMAKAKQLGQSMETVAIYEEIINKHPYYSDAYFYLGYYYYKSKDIKTASVNFFKALDINPKHKNAKTMSGNITKTIYNNGNKAYKRGDLSGARSKYLEVLEYDPAYIKSYYQLGVLEKFAGNSDQAEKYLNKAIDLDSTSYQSWFVLGAVYELDGKTDEAITCYRKSISIKYDYEKAYGNLGKLLYEVNQNYQEAESVLKEVTQIAPDYANGFFHLGMVYKIQGIELKKELDDSGSEDNGDYASVKKILQKAIDNLDNSVKLDNSNYDHFNHLAELYIAIEDWDKAIECAQKSTELKDRPRSNGSAYYYWGTAVLKKSKRRNKTRALSLFEKAKKDPNWRRAAEYEIVELRKEK